ncbi:hypothetical protein SUT503_11690 [Streptococcus parasuis]|nr:hypothetical protein SUT503_11690 [Streptococcus parasuis]
MKEARSILGDTSSAAETNQQISKAEADAQKQVESINEVTESYKAKNDIQLQLIKAIDYDKY